MNRIDIRSKSFSASRIMHFDGLRFDIATDVNNALVVNPMPDNWEKDFGDDVQHMRQNFPYTFKVKVSEKRNGAITYTPQLSANLKRHYGQRIAWIVTRTLLRLAIR